jgi:hypothetical protein
MLHGRPGHDGEWTGEPAACSIIPLIAGAAALGGLGLLAGNAALGGGTTQARVAAPDPKAYEYRGVGQDIYRQQGAAADARQAPLADYSRADYARGLGLDARAQQAGAVDLYRAAALGQGPSAAQAALRRGADESAAQAMALAAGARGSGAQRAAAQMQGIQAASQATQRIAADAAALRAQEQQAAMAGYLSGAAGMRSGDTALQGQDAAMAQWQAQQELASRQQNDARAMAYEGLGARAAEADQAGRAHAEDARIGVSRTNAGIEQTNAQQKNENWQKLGAGLLGLGSSMGSAAVTKSDRDAKTDVKDGSSSARAFLDALRAQSFRYKDSRDGSGEHLGVMAQDLERSEVGRHFVERGADGDRRVDFGRALGAMLAAEADLHGRVSGLEKALRARGRGR